LQFDWWQPKREIPVGYRQTRKGCVVVGALGFSRFGAGALIFSKEAPDVLWGMWQCVGRVGALPERLVVDREGCLHAGGGRPTGQRQLIALVIKGAKGFVTTRPSCEDAVGLVRAVAGAQLLGALKDAPIERSGSTAPARRQGSSTALNSSPSRSHSRTRARPGRSPASRGSGASVISGFPTRA
jgi:hypothetical protein